MILLRLSMTKINNNDDRGHPWRMPLEVGKNSEGIPLTKTAKQELVTQPMIQFTPIRGMSICRRRSLRKVQFTLSKALPRSSLRTMAFAFLVLMECKTSWVMPIGSVICRSFKKPNCWAYMVLLSKGFKRRATILEITL